MVPKMKMPAKQVRYCPYCNAYTEHTVKIESTRKLRSAMSKGQRRAKRRSKGHGNHGRYSKKPISNWKLRSKTTKKFDLVFTCTVCNKSWHMGLRRMKKLELVKD